MIRNKDGEVSARASGPLAGESITGITADEMKSGNKSIKAVKLAQDIYDKEGNPVGKRGFIEIFESTVRDAKRATELKLNLTPHNRKKFSASVVRHMERELKRMSVNKPTRLAKKCPVYTMAAVDGSSGQIQLAGYKVGEEFFSTAPTVPSGLAPKDGVPVFVDEKGVPECSLMEENVFVQTPDGIQQCVTPKCRSLITDVERLKTEQKTVATARLASVLKAFAGQVGDQDDDSILMTDPSVVRKAVGVSAATDKVNREFQMEEAKRALTDAVRQTLIARMVDEGIDRVAAQMQVSEKKTDIERYVKGYIDCASAFEFGTPSDVAKARKMCDGASTTDDKGNLTKCIYYGSQFKSKSGKTMPGMCIPNEFFKEGNLYDTKKIAGKAVRAAADVYLAKKAETDAEQGIVVLGGGGGSAHDSAEDPRLGALRAGTSKLAALARRATMPMSGGATSPYGAGSSRWAM